MRIGVKDLKAWLQQYKKLCLEMHRALKREIVNCLVKLKVHSTPSVRQQKDTRNVRNERKNRYRQVEDRMRMNPGTAKRSKRVHIMAART